MDTKNLYNFILKLTTTFDESQNAKDFVKGLENVLLKVIKLDFIKIYLLDENTFSIKEFEKPWENVIDEKEKENIDKVLNLALNAKHSAQILDDNMYIALSENCKITGVLKLVLDEKVDESHEFMEIVPLIQAQISYAVKNFKIKEKMRLATKFYKTIRNVAKIIENQYELNYILPILGEMIDSFVYEHLIYIFVKHKSKKEYKLVWPKKINNSKIYDYLDKLNSKSGVSIEKDGKIALFPLTSEQKMLGAIVAYNPFEKINEDEIEQIDEISKQASITIERAVEYTKILKDATLDALTGLNNRKQFSLRLKEQTAFAKRQKSPLCCIMFDIDHFKSVNDNYGHAVGDCVLKIVSKIIKKELRENDIASRYGGEEIAILLPSTELDEAQLVANRLREAIEKKIINIEEYNIENTKEISVTVSIGVSQYDRAEKDMTMLYQNADKALYEAKHSGRNRVVLYDDSLIAQ